MLGTTLRDLREEQHGAGGENRRGRRLGNVDSKGLIPPEFYVLFHRRNTVHVFFGRACLETSSCTQQMTHSSEHSESNMVLGNCFQDFDVVFGYFWERNCTLPPSICHLSHSPGVCEETGL